MNSRTNSNRARTLPLIMAGALAASAASLNGCNVVGAAAYVVAGPNRVPAAFEIPEDRSVLVFIDNRDGRIPERRLVATASAAVESELLNRVGIEDVVDSRPVQLLVRRESAESPMTIAEIGREVGASLVVYVAPDDFILSTDGASYSPSLSAYVKVIDTDSGDRLWPDDRRGYHLDLSPPPRPGLGPSTATDRRAGHVELANLLGQGIGQLFYDVDQFSTVR